MAGELVLIVEDNPLNMKLARDVLTFNGYQVVEAMTAEEGIVIACKREPALILMDIQLPGMDGVTAFKQLRQYPETQHIPVVALTASAMVTDRKVILAAGFDGYETKPISVKHLLETVRTVIDKHAKATRGGAPSAAPDKEPR
jgi:CheY-like chemotaxis protein